MTELIIATRNTHKMEEIQAVLSAGFCYRTLRDFPAAPEVLEDAPTFAGNATKKSLALSRWLSGNPRTLLDSPGVAEVKAGTHALGAEVLCLADDSGLEVDVLAGAPGVHSARFAALDSGAAGNSSDQDNNAKLLRLLAHVPLEKRTARFRCVIAVTPVLVPRPRNGSPVCSADEAEWRTEIFEGLCEGHLLLGPRGTRGFGYDPLFVPSGFEESFAELGEGIKNQISHRAKALQKLRAWLQDEQPQAPAPGSLLS